MSEKNRLDYCEGCFIKSICREVNPKSCELYQNHLKLQEVMKNLNPEDKQIRRKSSESYLQKTKRINELGQKFLKV